MIFFLLLIYASILGTSVPFAILYLKHNQSPIVMVYELLSGLYFSAVVFIFAFEVKSLGWYWFALTPLFMIFDYLFFYRKKSEELFPEDYELSETEKEVSFVGALIFIAPAYLIGISLLYDSLT